jgi:hypothetical protein
LASQLRFEGAELDDVLERVRAEVGPDARIVGANRIRKGGVGGFFAKEGFEVIVDLNGELPNSGSGNGAPKARRAAKAHRSRSAKVPASVLDLADEVSADEHEQVIDLGEPALSTEREDFGQMLSRLTQALDEEEALDIPTGQGPTGRPTWQMPTEPTVNEPVVEDRPVNPNAHYRRTTPDLTAPTMHVPQPAPAPATAPPPMPRPIPQQTPPQIFVTPPPSMPRPDERFVALGLPPELVPSTVVEDVRTALFQRLAQLPPPPQMPRVSGVVIAVVGIGTAPISIARRLADELEVPGENVILATPEAMSDLSHPEEAEAFRLGVRRRSEATVVACSIGPGRAQLGWAHRILDRLEPTITWGVVDASCKPEDIQHRVSLLGGIDVLALTGVADTVSPAAILSLGIPVGRIGSNHATPAVWADLLMERLER